MPFGARPTHILLPFIRSTIHPNHAICSEIMIFARQNPRARDGWKNFKPENYSKIHFFFALSVAATKAQPSIDDCEDESWLIVIIHHEYLIKLKSLI